MINILLVLNKAYESNFLLDIIFACFKETMSIDIELNIARAKVKQNITAYFIFLFLDLKTNQCRKIFTTLLIRVLRPFG